jgi:DNA helicase II / ATP-dependent DNA helicase PcrA
VWQTERPFELHLDGITITGRADVILDHEGDLVTRLAIVDYKTSVTGDGDNDLQLQVYADAGRSEGLDVRGAYVHDLRGRRRTAVDVSPDVDQGRPDQGDEYRPAPTGTRVLPAPRPRLRPM